MNRTKQNLMACYSELQVFLDLVIKKQTSQEFHYVADTIDELVRRSREKAACNGYDETLWLEGFLPIVAWVDESILCSSLSWREEWYRCQLQRKYFNINNAGELFFQKLEKMESISPEVLSVYEIVLATGFRGMHYQKSSADLLIDIRNTIAVKLRISALPSSEKLFNFAYQQQCHKDINQRKSTTIFNVFNIATVIIPVFILVILHLILEANLDRLLKNYNRKAFPDTPLIIDPDNAKAH